MISRPRRRALLLALPVSVFGASDGAVPEEEHPQGAGAAMGTDGAVGVGHVDVGEVPQAPQLLRTGLHDLGIAAAVGDEENKSSA